MNQYGIKLDKYHTTGITYIITKTTNITKAIKEAINLYDQLMLEIEQGLKVPKKALTVDDIWNEYVEFKSKKGGADEIRLISQASFALQHTLFHHQFD